MIVEEIPLKDAVLLPYSSIYPNPNQPREYFAEDAIADLRASIFEHGVTQPLLVTREVNRYDGRLFKILDGGRRYMAAEGITPTLPCIIKDVSPEIAAELALVANIQREDLTSLEEAKAVRDLMTTRGLSISAVAKRLGVSEGWVNNRIALLKTKPDTQRVAAATPDSMSSLLLVDKVAEPETRQELLIEVAKGTSFSEVKARVEAHQSAIVAAEKAGTLSAPDSETQSRATADAKGESASMSRGRRVTGGASAKQAKQEAERHIRELAIWVPHLSAGDFDKIALAFARRITRGDLSR